MLTHPPGPTFFFYFIDWILLQGQSSHILYIYIYTLLYIYTAKVWWYPLAFPLQDDFLAGRMHSVDDKVGRQLGARGPVWRKPPIKNGGIGRLNMWIFSCKTLDFSEMCMMMIRILGDLCPNRDLFCVLIMTHGDLASQELRLDHQPCDVYLIINIYIYTHQLYYIL